MCWTPAIIPTLSRVRCTIFVNIIDFCAVVEHVYSNRPTFKFCLLKIQEVSPIKRFVFTSKCTDMRLVAGTRWGSLQRSPRLSSRVNTEGAGKKGGGKKEMGGPQYLKAQTFAVYLPYKPTYRQFCAKFGGVNFGR